MATYNWYFSMSGGGNVCSQASPGKWLSSQQVGYIKGETTAQNKINSVNVNDTVNLFFKRGDTWTFDTDRVVPIRDYGLNIKYTNPTVHVDAYGSGAKPKFYGTISKSGTWFDSVPYNNATTGPLRWNRIFGIERNDCSFKNIHLDGIYGNGFFVPTKYAVDNITIDSVDVTNFGNNALLTSASRGTQNSTVTKCLIHTGQQLYKYSKHDSWGFAISFGPWMSQIRSAQDNVASYNIIYDIYGEGIHGFGYTAEYNIVGDTGSYGIYVCPSGGDSRNTTIRYNLVTQSSSKDYKNHPGSGYSGIVIAHEQTGGSDLNATINVYGNTVINRYGGLMYTDYNPTPSQWGRVNIFNNLVIDCDFANMIIAKPYTVSPGNGHWYNNVSILYDRPDSVHAAGWGDLANLSDYWTIDNNLFWTRGGSPVVDASWRKNAIIADPKLIGGNVIDWTGQSGPTYFKDIKFSDLYPMADSPLIGSGKPLDESFDNIYLTQGTDFSTLPNVPKFSLAMQTEVGNWDLGAIISSGLDLCDGVVCDNICIGNDLWSQKCVNGSCFLDQLIEQNSSTCGYDPCDGVVCDNICIGNDLWSQKCVNGDCFLDLLVQQNSITCGYDPCAGVVCDNICQGNDLWSQKCVNGSCFLDQLVEQNSSTCGPDPCAGVVCDNICQGNDLWSQKCVNGACFLDQLVQQNSSTCGPDPCAGVVCDNICQGNDLWSQKCVNGACFLDQLIEQNSVTCDLGPCENVFCHNTCVGYDLWSQICDPETGVCKVDQLLESNSATCMVTDYIPTDESTIKLYLVMGGLAFAGLGMVLLAKNK